MAKPGRVVRSPKFHPLCDIFPTMPEDEFEELVKSIAAHGLCEPITVLDGAIIDGRHRYLAAVKAGYRFRSEDFRDMPANISPVHFVFVANSYRRHLTATQRAAAASKAAKWELEMQEKGERRSPFGTAPGAVAAPETISDELELSGKKPTIEAVAESLDVSARLLKRTNRVAKERPDLADGIAAGTVTLAAAERALSADRAVKAHDAPTIDRAKRPIKVAELEDVLTDGTIGELLQDISNLKRRVADIAGRYDKQTDELVGGKPVGRFIPEQVMIGLSQAFDGLKYAEPWTTCPFCNGTTCKSCGDSKYTAPPWSGWLPLWRWRQVPRELKGGAGDE